MIPNDWFDNCGGFRPRHDLAALRAGIAAGWTDARNGEGLTALMLAALSDWRWGVEELCRAGADREARDPHTGATALYLAAIYDKAQAAAALLAAGADADEPNYWGVTPRQWLGPVANGLPVRERPLPPPHVQDAEHLAEQHHPHFGIPVLAERLKLRPGQAVTLYVYGPKAPGKQDDVKVRITARRGAGDAVRYEGDVETPLERTHLAAGTQHLEFGPKNVASIYYPADATRGEG